MLLFIVGNETVVDVYLHDNVAKPETITRPQEDSPSTSWWGSKVYENSPSTSYNNIFNNFDSTMNQSNHLESDYTPLDDTVLVKSEPRDDYSDMQIKLEIKLEPVEIILPVSKSDLAYSDSDQIATNVDLISTRSDSAYGCSDTASMSFEHDYCDVVEEQFVDNEIEVKEDLFLNQFLLEHSYSVLSGTEIPESSCENMTKSHSVIVNGDVDNKLIFGLGLNYLKEKIVNVHNVVLFFHLFYTSKQKTIKLITTEFICFKDMPKATSTAVGMVDLHHHYYSTNSKTNS